MQKRPTVIFGGNYGPDIDFSRWVVIYPPYIDKLRKESEGRKIGKDKCVEKPRMDEIFDCAQLLKFQTALELDKAYSRDYWVRGRIRVRLFDENGKPVREDIPTRRILYARVAQLIPQHRERMKSLQNKNQKTTAAKPPQAGKQVGGKSAPLQPKKKKKGKR